ncbi:MAG: radical SAM protein, partial [Lachnospiraceae bacterium]|nr:radical SAM protein [Lachnospiraceae bacterium]
AYRACGINRISFGLQSADNAELAALGRIHTWETFLDSYGAARRAGFTNINIDLMSALPGQTARTWEKTLRRILSLAPEHISAYSLIIEEGTPFYEKYHEDDLRRADGEQPRFLPSEEEEREMYVLTERLLGEAGLEHYEISNYARPGYECRHNIGYWRGAEYMGFGLGASSFLRFYGREPEEPHCQVSYDRSAFLSDNAFVGVRFSNPVDFEEYDFFVRERASEYVGIRAETRAENHEAAWTEPQMESQAESWAETQAECLSVEDEMGEFMMLGLRMLSGVSEQDFLRRFHRPMDSVYGNTIARFCSLGLLERRNGRIFLTQRGMDLSNLVMAEFLPD